MGAQRRVESERSAGGVVFRRFPEGPHVLLIRDPYQNWGLPKGHIEPGEGPRDAALREVEEETGLRCAVVGDELSGIDWYFRRDDYVVHKTCRFFLMESASGDPRPEEGEGITECRWVPWAEAVRQITYDNARGVLVEAAPLVGVTLSTPEPETPGG